jgi:hypothetical protein
MIRGREHSKGVAVAAALICVMGSPLLAVAQESGDEPNRNEEIQKGALENYEARQKAIDTLADQLASDDMKRLEFVATSMEQAMRRVKMVVEPLFNEAYSRLGDVDSALRLGSDVVEGFNEHTIRLSSVGRTTGAVQIIDDADARLAGELLAAVVRIVDRLQPKLGDELSPRALARKIFSQTTIYETSSASPINQYLETVTGLAEHSDEELLRYLGSS